MIKSYVYTPTRECGRLSYWIRQQNDGAENVLADGGKCPELLPREGSLGGVGWYYQIRQDRAIRK